MSQTNLLRAIEDGEFEGIPFKVTGSGEDINPGDTYLAERNSGVRLLTCKENDLRKKWIVPEENAYLFDTWECVRIEFLI